MFSDEEIKEIPEGGFLRPGDEIISIQEVCLSDKIDKKDLGLPLLPSSSRNDLDVTRSLFRDGFFPEGLEQQARFAWTEEDGNIATLVSEPGFGTTGQTTFGKQIDSALKSEMKEADTSSSVLQPTNRSKSYGDSQLVSSTSTENRNSVLDKSKITQGAFKVDKTDPRSRFHFVKYVKRHGRTVKLWECGICGREFQHQYTLMRHLPTHTDERNFHCTTCGKSFRQLSTLSQHKAIHSAERPYSCEVCNKTFNRVSTLISHRKTHSDEKPYKCHICPKGFHQKGNLRNHLFTHTNERPYRCNICFKGFNQQSNLVCHKNKTHPEDGGTNDVVRRNIVPSIPRDASDTDKKLDKSRSKIDHCEVSSSVGPHLPSANDPSSSWNSPSSWELSAVSSESGTEPWSLISGVIVDPIKTYHMEVAIATKQTPFALLKPDDGAPVLVKVVDTSLPGGKQMLVPATAEDLRSGGKIVVKKDGEDNHNQVLSKDGEDHDVDVEGAVQIRVPVVATVVSRIRAGGRLHLSVEEPHRAYHTALSADLREVNVEPCSLKPLRDPPQPGDEGSGVGRPTGSSKSSSPPESRYIELNTNHSKELGMAGGSNISASCVLPPPPPSPPLDLIPMDLFEPMECMPLGPQITAVGHIDQPPPSDDSDIFIGEFEESIQLSDSD